MSTKVQHYVWRGYLKRWTLEGDTKGKVFVYRKKPMGNLPQLLNDPVPLTNVGYEKYYYDVSGFTDKDVSFFFAFLKNIQKDSWYELIVRHDVILNAQSKRDCIEDFMGNYENIDNKYGFIERIINNDMSFYKDSVIQLKMNELMEETVNGILYGKFTKSEGEMLDSFVEGLEHLDADDYKYEFHRYLFMQYLRSPARIEAQKKGFERLQQLHPDEIGGINSSFYAIMISIYLAEKMALNITQNFHTWIERIDNLTDELFLTTDTPLICITGPDFKDVSKFYYPLSPKIAMYLYVARKNDLLPKEVNKTVEVRDVNTVKELNIRLIKQCRNEIYALKREELENLNDVLAS